MGPASAANPQPQKPAGPTNVEVVSVALPPGRNNASDIAAALKGNIPQMVSVTALSNAQLIFVLDVSPTKTGDTKLQDPKPLEDQIKGWVNGLAQMKSPLAVEIYQKTLPLGSGSASDLATKLNNLIPGVTNIIPLGNTSLVFLLDQTPDPRFPSTPRDIAGLKNKIDNIVAGLAIPQPFFYMSPFPLGTSKNCDIANALAKQLPGVLNISPVGSTRLAFEIDPRLQPADREALEKTIDEYVSALAEPVTATSPNTETYTQRLFYDHDPTTAAAIIQAAYPEVKAAAIIPDTVVLSETIPARRGEKRDPLQDARRMVAQIDQPRPQVSLDAWSIQVSTTSEHTMAKTGPLIDSVAKKYNDVMAKSTLGAWQFLVTRLANPYLDPVFSDYLTGQVVVPAGGDCCALMSAPGNYRYQTPNYTPGSLGYSLGYRTLFSSLPPNLIYMLVTLAATRNPQLETELLINTMETGNPHTRSFPGDGECQARDQSAYAAFLENHGHSTLQLECVRDLLRGQLFAPGVINPATGQLEMTNTTSLGRLRAAIADFLFQYKMMIEYREDFEPFSVAQSAANLDAQLSPVVDAFTSDLEVFQRQIKNEIEDSDLLKNRKSGIAYAASGIVSVKVVGGNQANVQTTTQNYFDATPPSTLGDFAAAIKSIGTGTTSSTGTVPPSLPGFLTSNMTGNEAVAALAAIQALTRTPVSARIGKGLILSATPYSLSGASGAEMDISVESNENGAELLTAATASNLSSVTAQTDDLASRVSDHKVSTRVRVDSLKLFDLSTMESVLARGKTPWKPIDPWLEIPVLGDVVRVPRKPAITYHRSFIFINAFLVPTAADLASGIRINGDLIFTAIGIAKTAHEVNQLGGAANRIAQFHQHMLDWFAAETIDSNGDVQSPVPIPVLSDSVSVQ
jgi:hypothetical protein